MDTLVDGKNCGACGHDCLGGACTNGTCQPFTLVGGQVLTSGIAIEGKSVVWSRRKGSATSGGLFRIDLDGKNQAAVRDYTTSNLDVSQLVVGGGVAYFARSVLGSDIDDIVRCALPDCAGGEQIVASNQTTTGGLALDAADNRLYWVLRTKYNSSTGGAVMTAVLPNGPASRLVPEDQANPTAPIVAAGYLYWLAIGTYTNNNFDMNSSVRRAPKGGSSSASTITNDTVEPSVLAVDGSRAYFGSSQGLYTAPLNAGASSATNFQVPAYVTGIVVDGGTVFWTANDTVFSCPAAAACASPTVLATNRSGASMLVTDKVSLVWVNRFTGELQRLAR